jgi:hypothetical protein
VKKTVYLSLDEETLDLINAICEDRKIPRVIFLRQIIEDHLEEAPNELREVKEGLDEIKNQISTLRLGSRFDPKEIKGLTERTAIAQDAPIRVSLIDELKNVMKKRGDAE